MGNGALPNGPSYRAHPRLYQSRHPDRVGYAVRKGGAFQCVIWDVERQNLLIHADIVIFVHNKSPFFAPWPSYPAEGDRLIAVLCQNPRTYPPGVFVNFRKIECRGGRRSDD